MEWLIVALLLVVVFVVLVVSKKRVTHEVLYAYFTRDQVSWLLRYRKRDADALAAIDKEIVRLEAQLARGIAKMEKEYEIFNRANRR